MSVIYTTPSGARPDPGAVHGHSEAGRKMRFDLLRYAFVWEDIDLLYQALDVGPDDDVLSITSAGDNVLGLLLKAPRSVTAVDLNACQGALLELKLAAIRTLEHDAFLRLLGVTPGRDRVPLYRRCRRLLPAYARRYWDVNWEKIARGLVGQGRLERYVRGWMAAVLHQVVSRAEVEACFRLDSLEAQRAFFARHLDTPAFRAAFAWYFGARMMAERGRDPAQFAYVDGDVGAHFYSRFKHAFTQLPLKDNFYLEFFMTGRLRPERLPPYLLAANYDRLRSLADRVTVVTDEVERLALHGKAGQFSKGNFSDLFEYISAENAAALLAHLHRLFRPGGRLAYWSLLVDRSLPPSCRPLYSSHDDLAHRLWQRDRAWFYRSFHILEVQGSTFKV